MRFEELNSRPFVSVIIPVYNAEDTISRCLDSILNQTFKSYEIIAINDGSQDGSLAILCEYARLCSKIRIINQTNHGAAYARNTGIAYATGVYLTFIDNDDWIDSSYLETLCASAAEIDADIILSGYRRPDARGIVREEHILSDNSEWSCFAVEAAWAKLFKRSFVLENNLSFLEANISEDLAFTLPAITTSNNKVILPYCGYNWYINPTSISNTVQKTSVDLDFEYALNVIFNRLVANNSFSVDPILEYLFVRHIVWFLFWTSTGDDWKVLQNNCERYVSWLTTHLPNWRMNTLGTPLHPTGDSLSSRVATLLFIKSPSLALKMIRLHGLLSRI